MGRHPLAGSVEKATTLKVKEAVFEWMWNRRGCRQIAPEGVLNLHVVDMVGVYKKRKEGVIGVEVKIDRSDLRRDLVTLEESVAFHQERVLVRKVAETVRRQIEIEARVKLGVPVVGADVYNPQRICLTTNVRWWGRHSRLDRDYVVEKSKELSESYYAKAYKQLPDLTASRKPVGKFYFTSFVEMFSELWIACTPNVVDLIPGDLPVGVLLFDDGLHELKSPVRCELSKEKLKSNLDFWRGEIARVNTQRLVQLSGGEVLPGSMSWPDNLEYPES